MKLINNFPGLLLTAGLFLLLTPAFAQNAGSTGKEDEPKQERDISGLYKGRWRDLQGQSGAVEIKIYRSYEETYGGYLLFKDLENSTYTGSLSFSLTDGYFSGYYTPSVMAYDPEISSQLNCQLVVNGIIQPNKKGELILKGEGVSSGCQTNGILHLELEQHELIAHKQASIK